MPVLGQTKSAGRRPSPHHPLLPCPEHRRQGWSPRAPCPLPLLRCRFRKCQGWDTGHKGGALSVTSLGKAAWPWLFMVPTRQQSPHPGAQSRVWVGVFAALPGVLALGDSTDPGGAGMLVPGMGTARTGLAAQTGWFAAPSCPVPMARISSIPVLARLSPSQEGSCCPTPQRCARRTRRRTSLLLYTNRAGIGTQCCPRQEGGRQTEREGDIREALRANCRSTEENRLQQQQLGVRPAKHSTPWPSPL